MNIISTSFKSAYNAITPTSGYVKGDDPLFSGNVTFRHNLPKYEEMALGLKYRPNTGSNVITLYDGDSRISITIDTNGDLSVVPAMNPVFTLQNNIVSKGLDIAFHIIGGTYRLYINGFMVTKIVTTPSNITPIIRVVGGGTKYINSMYVKEGSVLTSWKVAPAQYSFRQLEVEEYTLLHGTASGAVVVSRDVEFDPAGFTVLLGVDSDTIEPIADVPDFTKSVGATSAYPIGTVFKFWKDTPYRKPLTYRVI